MAHYSNLAALRLTFGGTLLYSPMRNKQDRPALDDGHRIRRGFPVVSRPQGTNRAAIGKKPVRTMPSRRVDTRNPG